MFISTLSIDHANRAARRVELAKTLHKKADGGAITITLEPEQIAKIKKYIKSDKEATIEIDLNNL